MLHKFVEELLNEVVSIEFPMSEFCNLRCSYCYITDTTYKKRHIQYEDIKKLWDKVPDVFPKFRSKDTTLYIIPWGAEPLCNWNVIEKILREVLPENKNLKTKWSTNATIIPNGYIDFIKEFKDQIDGIQISLDGPEEVQNSTRYYIDHSGSFEDVMHHLEVVRASVPDIEYTFKPTLNSDQIEQGFFYKSVKFFLTDLKEAVAPTTIVADNTFSSKAVIQFRKDFERLYLEWDSILAINPDASINLLTKFAGPATAHCSACKNEIGVDMDGSIYPCHGPITGSQYLKDLYHLGNIFSGELDEQGIYRFMYAKYNSKILMSPLCQNCKVHKLNPCICYVCQFDNIRGTGSSWMTPSSVCEMRRVIADYYERWRHDRT